MKFIDKHILGIGYVNLNIKGNKIGGHTDRVVSLHILIEIRVVLESHSYLIKIDDK